MGKVGTYDGTVVDVIDPDSEPPVLRIYWRQYQGRVGSAGVKDHYANHLRRMI